MIGSTLTVNAGSSSIKFALFGPGSPPRRTVWGQIDNIGRGEATLVLNGATHSGREILGSLDHAETAKVLVERLETSIGLGAIAAIGHRVVHGGPSHGRPERITPGLLAYLKGIVPYAPRHLPVAIGLIEALAEAKDVMQVACFDTYFHSTMPPVAKTLPIPRRLAARGLRRYGFHGLSYAYLIEELARLYGPQVGADRVILAHLGNGASLAAVRDGRSIDTSMGFTPASGIPMSTRSGEVDPGLFVYLTETERMSAHDIDDMLSKHSGLLGLSETSGDIRDLLAVEATDARAAEAVALFCYQVRKYIGAYAAALGGLDTLVFSGGIGEHNSVVRARICEGLGFLGIDIDAALNEANSPRISNGSVDVRVIATDEEVMIAKGVVEAIDGSNVTPNTEETGHG